LARRIDISSDNPTHVDVISAHGNNCITLIRVMQLNEIPKASVNVLDVKTSISANDIAQTLSNSRRNVFEKELFQSVLEY
jgi:hypothetical protein